MLLPREVSLQPLRPLGEASNLPSHFPCTQRPAGPEVPRRPVPHTASTVRTRHEHPTAAGVDKTNPQSQTTKQENKVQICREMDFTLQENHTKEHLFNNAGQTALQAAHFRCRKNPHGQPTLQRGPNPRAGQPALPGFTGAQLRALRDGQAVAASAPAQTGLQRKDQALRSQTVPLCTFTKSARSAHL